MAIQFPADPGAQTPANTLSPTSTPVANTENDLTFTWNGSVWNSSGGGDQFWERDGTTLSPANDGDDIETSGDATVSGTVNATTYQHESGTGNNIILSADGDTQVNSLNGGQLAGFRNQLINGAMVIAQRGSGPVTTVVQSGTYTCVDRFTVDDVTSSQRPVADLPGFSKTLRIINGGRYKVRQAIELNTPGYNCQFSVGSTWTASLWSTADITVGNLSLVFADLHTGTGFVEAAGSQSWAAIETIGRWTRYKATVTITGTAAGTNQCLLCEFNLAEGDFSGFQLEPGPVATPFEHRPIGTELALCQRYYQVIPSGFRICNTVPAGLGQANIGIIYSSPMRTTPTASGVTYSDKTGNFNARNNRHGDFTVTSTAAFSLSTTSDLTLDAEF